MWVWTNLCNRQCSFIAGNDFMRVWTNLCDRESFSVTVGGNSILNFPAKIRTGMCKALLCADWWWLITQPRPIWKKAPPGLQRPSQIFSSIWGDSQWPPLVVPHLGPDLEVLLELVQGGHPVIKKRCNESLLMILEPRTFDLGYTKRSRQWKKAIDSKK